MKSSHMLRLSRPTLAIATCIAFSACGGGGGDSAEKASIAAIQPGSQAASDLGLSQAPDAAASAASAAEAASAASGPSAHALASTGTQKPATAPSTKTATSAKESTAQPAGAQASTTAPASAKPIATATTGGAATSYSAPSIPSTQTPAPTQNLKVNFAEPTQTAPAVATATPPAPNFIELKGTGINSVYAEGCTPSIKSDFIDAGTWTTRRLEPRDCAIVPSSTPIFSWRQPSTRDKTIAWTFTLRKASGELVLTRQTMSPRLLLADPALAPGLYNWSVSFTDTKKQVINSEARRFAVPGGTSIAKLPSGLALATAAANKARPRLLPAGATAAKVATAARASELNTSFTAFLAAADKALIAAPSSAPTVAPKAAQSITDAATLTAIKKQTEAEHEAIEALGYGYIFTGDTKYQTAGIARVMALAAWSTSGPTSEAIQDQANRQIYLALAKGLDYFAPGLTTKQTATIVATLKNRVLQAKASVANLDVEPYNSHVLTATQFITEAMLYAVGTPGFPEARTWLAEAWEIWLTATIGTWGGSTDGAYGNGEAYGWYTLSSFAITVATVRLVANTDLSNWAPVSKFGDNQIAFTSPFGPARSAFGDDAERTSHYWDYGRDGYRLYASLTRAPAHEWYWRQNPTSVAYRFAVSPANYMMLGLYPARPSPAAPTQNSWSFEDAGLVAIHSKTTEPARSSVFFRSSRLGSFNHSHADNNSFNFSSKGLPLLISAGYYPYYNSPHHATVARATRFKNALTFDGGIGQAEPSATPTGPGKPVFTMDARGQLLNFADTGPWAAATGDASLAYQGQNQSNATWTPLLSNAVRSVAYNRAERVLIIYDWATSASNRTWELNFQTLNPATVNGKTVKVINGIASACIDVHGLAGSTPNLSSGFPIAPENGGADQHRAKFSAASPSRELVAVTVVREDCRSMPIAVTFNGSQATVSINGGTAAAFDKKAVKLPL